MMITTFRSSSKEFLRQHTTRKTSRIHTCSSSSHRRGGGVTAAAAASLILVVSLVGTISTASRTYSSSCFAYAAGSPSFLVSTGLKNLGNTCYLNAQLQCAYHIPLVRNMILNPPPTPAKKNDDDDTTTTTTTEISDEEESPEDDDTTPSRTESEDGSEVMVSEAQQEEEEEEEEEEPEPESLALQALRLLLQDMNNSAQNNGQAVEPRVLCHTLGIPVMEQQDSNEFWKLFLPALKLTPLIDLYQGAFEDYIKALDGSGRERCREEAFLDLSLDVQTTGSVPDALEKMFGEPELLSEADGNGWRPEKGADKVDAHKGSTLILHGLPSILQLHLKRFDYDWNTDTTSKLNNPFSFPLELDLSSLCKDGDDANKQDPCSLLYDLQAIVVHAGMYGSGHYYAYIRPDVRKDEWCRFNDHVVNAVTFDEVYNDSVGGKAPTRANSGDSKPRHNPFQRILSVFSSKSSYGFGGRTSNAYVLQYVKRADIPTLYE